MIVPLANVVYRTQTASEAWIRSRFEETKASFVPPLDTRVDIGDYAAKISERAVTFEAWVYNNLVGLVAAYFDDMENRSAHVTSVSISANHRGRGIASELMKICIAHARQHGFSEIRLEMHRDNRAAISLYIRHGFVFVVEKDGFIQMKRGVDIL